MTHTTKPISPLRQRMIEDMALRKLAPKTESNYLRAVINFTCFLGRSPDTASPEDLRRYQLHLVETGISSISLNGTITALRFLFGVTLDRAEVMTKMNSVREPLKLPVVLSLEEVVRLIDAAGTPKCQTALSVAYGADLRASEVVALKVGDVDSTRMTPRVEQGKGRKDQYAMLSPVLLQCLRTWWQAPPRQSGRCSTGAGQGPGGSRKPGCDHDGRGQQNYREQVVWRLDMIEARIVKMEAMLESLMRRCGSIYFWISSNRMG